MTFQHQEIRVLITLGILPLKLCHQGLKSWRTFVCLTDLVQGGDPLVAASEVEAASCS